MSSLAACLWGGGGGQGGTLPPLVLFPPSGLHTHLFPFHLALEVWEGAAACVPQSSKARVMATGKRAFSVAAPPYGTPCHMMVLPLAFSTDVSWVLGILFRCPELSAAAADRIPPPHPPYCTGLFFIQIFYIALLHHGLQICYITAEIMGCAF